MRYPSEATPWSALFIVAQMYMLGGREVLAGHLAKIIEVYIGVVIPFDVVSNIGIVL